MNCMDHNLISVQLSSAIHPSPSKRCTDENPVFNESAMGNASRASDNQIEPETTQDKSYSSKDQSCKAVCAFALFTIIAMTIGIITVCLGLPKETNKKCEMKFERTAQGMFISDSRPQHVATGDFNGDNHLDLAIATTGSDNIGIRRGYGNGTFSSRINYSTGLGSLPYWVAIGDFNNDTLLDIVVANYGTHNIGLFLGYGNLSFSDQLTFPCGSSRPISLAIGDFNQDNLLDIAVVSNGTSHVSILLGFGNGSFQMHTNYDMGYDSMPYSIATADFNNDKQLDIVVINYGTSNFAILLATRNGTFSISKYSTGNGSHPCSVAIDDFNNDDFIDIAIVNSATDKIGIFLGDEDGIFTMKATYSTGSNSHPQFIAVGNFSKENTVDIIVANSGTDNVILLEGYGDGTFSIKATHSTGYNSNPYSIAVGDFDNDTISDVVVINNGINSILVLRSYTIYLLANQTKYSTGDNSFPYLIAVDDFNNDKQLDIVVTDILWSNIDLFIGHSNGTFENQKASSVIKEVDSDLLLIGDFNNDKQADIVVTIYYSNELGIYLGDGTGNFDNGYICMVGNNSIPSSIAIGDFDGDKNLDILVANNYGDNVGFLHGYGNGTFAEVVNYPTGYYSPIFISVGDFNNDNLLDFVSADYDSPWSAVLNDFNKDAIVDIAVLNPDIPSINIFLGDGHGNFPKKMTLLIEDASNSYSIATGDFNNDKEVDIAVANFGTNDISVLLLRYQPDFVNSTVYYQKTNPHPSAVAIGDFNNDYQLDIVVTNAGIDNVQIFLDYKEGTFMNNITYSTGDNSHPQHVVVTDFNKDNQLDIAVVNSYNSILKVFLSSGNETFSASSEYITGYSSFPNSVAVGDFNKDGWIDVVVANSGTDNIGIFLGFDYPTFTTSNIVLQKRDSSPYYIAIGDFNNDSRWDIAIACRERNNIAVFLGNGNGTFSEEQLFYLPGSSRPQSLIIGDFNNDNQLDIAVANSRDQSISLLFGRGNGSFAPYISQETIYSSPVSIAVGDFNNDRKQDIVVAIEDTNTIGIFIGHGNGSFKEQISYEMPDESSPVWVVVGDFNNDNVQDIAVANFNGHNIGILLGYGDGAFRNVTLYSTGNNSGPCSIAIGDFNKDNWMDIAVANKHTQNVGIFFGYDNGSFSSQTTYMTDSGSMLMSIVVGDINNDGILDIAISDFGSGKGNIGVLYGLDNGTFLVSKIYSTGINTDPSSIAICDIDNDGRLDFIVSNSNKNNIGIMLRDKSEPLGKQTMFSTDNGSSPYAVVVSHFNDDDHLDIAVANSKTNNIGIFLGYGNGSFANQEIYSTGIYSSPKFIAVGDLNNDKQMDIIVANSNTGNICIFLGNRNGTFIISQNYSTGQGSEPSSIAVADLNKDNKTDIIITNSGINNVLVFFGSDNGIFSKPKTYSLDYGSHPISVAIGDFNNDSWLDIVVANDGSGYVEVLLQTC
ncbi:unnamed protein product [Rotaria sordida]|uniref:Uncharacterized protein n=2 Tax=Rotaria sordida TaxID=392033 RepID=A0A815F6H0_9BILA|nr:unnamed protein product [Rotaria sordida]